MLDVELRWWAGCPSTDQARAELREVLDDLGLKTAEVRMTEITDDARARAIRFPGSPTILIDGEDVVAVAEGDQIGLTCRVYRRRDGRISPTPDPADVRDAIEEVIR